MILFNYNNTIYTMGCIVRDGVEGGEGGQNVALLYGKQSHLSDLTKLINHLTHLICFSCQVN